ncbi:MAG: hypothetical protein OXD01_08295 [Gammaproteobacteria bacterium]|nr:hypothetical protein [Gammaproteobacteria bacterium]
MKQHTGTVLLIRQSYLLEAANLRYRQSLQIQEILARPWAWSCSPPHHTDRSAYPSILLSEINLGTDNQQPFHFDSLLDLAIRVVIAPMFGPSVLSDAVRHGILLVPIPVDLVHVMQEGVAQAIEQPLEIDLEALQVRVPGLEPISFDTDPRLRSRLLSGMDDLDELRLYRTNARLERERDRAKRPWLYSATNIDKSV